jgi:hypothetical protein
MGDVIQLPRRQLTTPVATVQSLSRAATAPWLTAWDIDDWGRDDTLARAAARLAGVRWTTVTGGLAQLPTDGPALLVVNTRRFRLTPWWAALALSAELGRPVRFVGRTDTAPLGALARRLGGLLARSDEIAGALRHGQLLVVGLTGTLGARTVGTCDPRLLAPAVEQRCPVFPLAADRDDSSRRARLEVAPAIPRPRRRGPLAEVEMAQRVEARISELLESFGDGRTGTPLDWLPVPTGGR